MNELRNSKSDDQLEELLLLTEQMQEELDQKDRTTDLRWMFGGCWNTCSIYRDKDCRVI